MTRNYACGEKMKKTILGLFLIIILVVAFYWLFSAKYKIIFEWTDSSNNKATGIEQYFSSKYKSYSWIDPKDEESLIHKMGFQKTVISPAKEENPSTIIKILNFSSKPTKELDIYSKKNPFYHFSETYSTPPVYLYTIKDVTVFPGEDTRKSLLFKNGFYTSMGCEFDSIEKILPKLMEKEDIFYLEKNTNIYSVKDLTELSEIKNKTIFFHGDWNFYHIIMDTSPGLLLINDTDYKITLSYFSKQNTDVVEELGNPYIIPTEPSSFEKFSELVIPSPILEENAHLPNIELMNKLIKKLKTNFSKKSNIKPLGKKIYVSRSDASRRKVLNETDLIKYLKTRDFKIVSPGKYSVADQSKLFEEAEIIIGPHGMGLINMIFSNNLKTVIELFPSSHYPNCYLRTAQIKGAKNYYGLIHDSEGLSTNWFADYKVNIPEILKILDTLEK